MATQKLSPNIRSRIDTKAGSDQPINIIIDRGLFQRAVVRAVIRYYERECKTTDLWRWVRLRVVFSSKGWVVGGVWGFLFGGGVAPRKLSKAVRDG